MPDQARRTTQYVLSRLFQMMVILALLSILVFALARACPGDPLRSWYGDGIDRMSEAQKELARENLGLNDSILTQYVRWVSNAFHGDLGISFKYKQPVTRVIAGVWFNTLILGVLSYVLTFFLAFELGKFCALREGRRSDRILQKIGVMSGNIPTFFLALLSILIFAVQLRVLPAGGAYDYGFKYDMLNRLYHLVLPCAVMVTGHLWYYAYMIRNKLLEETRKDYVLLCKAEGIPRRRILSRYCMKNIMPSMLSIMAVAVPHILGGTYIVEMVFAYPGLGTLSFESALYQDYNMLMALTMITGCVVLISNILAEILGELLDPRMRYAASGEEAV